MFNLDDLKNNPLNFAQTVDLALLKESIVFLNDHYRKGKPIVSDDIFDLLNETCKQRDSNHHIIQNDNNGSNRKIKLPVFMGSMDKLKPKSTRLHKFIMDDIDYILSDKLDGISLLVLVSGGNYKCYTRGDGKIGEDITYLLNEQILFKDGIIPDIDIIVRGELIIEKKNSHLFKSNIRNIVSGYSNRNNVDTEIQKYLRFIVYEVIGNDLLPTQQMEISNNYFNTVNHQLCNNFDNTYLENYFQNRKKYSSFDIDGIIITKNINYKHQKSGNPKHSVAFKMINDEQIKETVVTGVKWTPSKDGYLKPVVHYEPIVIGGCNYTKANGVNAQNIVKNKIGIGSQIKVIRAGDVIPNIFEVMTEGEVIMPDLKWTWNESGKDIVLDERTDEQDIQEIVYFFKVLKIKGVSDKLIRKIVSYGFDTLGKILQVKRNELLKMDGIQNKTADNIIENILNAVENSDICKIMTASNCFGRSIGEKKIQNVIDNIKDVIKKKYTDEELYNNCIKLNDFGDSSTRDFIVGLKKFKDFMKTHPYIQINYSKNVIEGNIFNNISICFTGIRNEELENHIRKNNGIIVNQINKANILIYKTKSNSQKFKEAIEKNIEIIQIEDFINKYCK